MTWLRSAAPLTAVTAALIAVVIGVTSSAAIVFAAARAAGANDAELASWMLALFVGMGVAGIGLSLRYRAPIITAWSTPGAALLATGLNGVGLREAIGAFLISAALITLAGVTGWFARVMDRVPVPLAAALLGGVLVQFGIGLFTQMQHRFALVLTMFATYLACRRLLHRYAVLAALAAGVLVAALTHSLHLSGVHLALARPVFTVPAFSVRAAFGVALPLFVVTMASQNLPGVAVLRNDGYDRVPVSPLIAGTGAANLVLAPFGAFGLNLAAITAAICTGPQAHPDPRKRYVAGVWTGVFYLAGHRGDRVAGHDQQLTDLGAVDRPLARGGRGHLPGHGVRAGAAGDRIGVLGADRGAAHGGRHGGHPVAEERGRSGTRGRRCAARPGRAHAPGIALTGGLLAALIVHCRNASDVRTVRAPHGGGDQCGSGDTVPPGCCDGERAGGWWASRSPGWPRSGSGCCWKRWRLLRTAATNWTRQGMRRPRVIGVSIGPLWGGVWWWSVTRCCVPPRRRSGTRWRRC